MLSDPIQLQLSFGSMFWQDLIDFVCRPWPLSVWLLALVGFVVQARLSFTCLGCFRKRSPRLSHNLQINIFCWLLYSFAILLWQTYGFVMVDPMQRSGRFYGLKRESIWTRKGEKSTYASFNFWLFLCVKKLHFVVGFWLFIRKNVAFCSWRLVAY